MYALMTDDVDRLVTIFSGMLQQPFIDLPDGPVLFGEAIEGMRNLRFGFPSLEPAAFTRTLHAHLRTLVETEVLARIGYKKNLQAAEPVQKDLRMWEGYWTSRFLMWRVNDSVRATPEEIRDAFRFSLPEIGSVYQVNIQEVLTDSLTQVLRAMDDYARGVPLSEVAKKYTKRKEWREKGGISGFIALNQYPEITVSAFLADTGSIVGPLTLPEGYSFFRVLGKRSIGGAEYPDTDSLVINISNNILGKKRARSMNSYVAGLAKNYTVQINVEKLKSVTIQPANMFMRRMIGFGGIITAVPMLYPNWEWIKEFKATGVSLP
jgi:hypothetical protein